MEITTTSGMHLDCMVVSAKEVLCNGTTYRLPDVPLSYTDPWFWGFLGIYVGLVLFAGLMSGLTLGMLSLDMMTLKVLQEAGSPKEKKYSSRIMPVVKRHHLLLVTLLLANAVAVESMPLCLDRVSDPITAIVVSVTAVLMFGEVFPQSLCSRYGLAIGATMVPLVYVLMAILFVIAWPLSKLLDCLLGSDHATFFRRAELKALVGLHGPDRSQYPQQDASVIPEEGPLSIDEVLIIKGALEMRDKTAQVAMLPLDSVFMIEVNAKMDRPMMKRVLHTAHSRVPVYEGHRDNILGVLLVKTLLLLNPDDAEPVSKLILNARYSRQVAYVHENRPLYDILNEFQTGKSHLAFVLEKTDAMSTEEHGSLEFGRNKPPGTMVVGIITLEDIIEELLQEEIIDETDVFVDVEKRIRVARARTRQLIRSTAYSTHTSTPFSTPYSTPARTPNRTPVPKRKKKASRSTSQVSTDIPPADSTDKTPLLAGTSAPSRTDVQT